MTAHEGRCADDGGPYAACHWTCQGKCTPASEPPRKGVRLWAGTTLEACIRDVALGRIANHSEVTSDLIREWWQREVAEAEMCGYRAAVADAVERLNGLLTAAHRQTRAANASRTTRSEGEQ